MPDPVISPVSTRSEATDAVLDQIRNFPATKTNPIPAAPQTGQIQPAPLTTQNPYEPGSPLREYFDNFQRQGDAAKAAVPGGGQGLATATQGAKTVLEGQTRLNTAQAAADAKLQRDNAEVMMRFGMTPGAESAAVLQMAAQIDKDSANLLMRDRQITQKLDQSFFDNPIEWLSNQFALPYDIAARNSVENTINATFENLHQRVSATNETFNINKQIDVIDANERMIATNTIAKGLSEQAIAEAQFKAAGLGIQAAGVRNAITKSQYDAAVAMQNEQVKYDTLRMSAVGQQIAVQESDNKTTETQLRIIDRQRADAKDDRERLHLTIAGLGLEYQRAQDEREQERLSLQIQKNSKELVILDQNELINRERITQEKIQSSNALEIQEGIAESQKRLDITLQTYHMPAMPYRQFLTLPDGPTKSFIAKGMLDPNVQKRIFGYDAANALEEVKKLPSFTVLTPGEIENFKFLNGQEAIVAQGKMQTMKSLSPEEKHVLIQGQIEKATKDIFMNIKDEGTPYSPPALSKALTSPYIENLPIMEYLKTIAVASPEYKLKAQDVITAVLEGITNNKYSPGAAAIMISDLYKGVQIMNNEIYQYQKFQLPSFSDKTGYRQTVQTGGALFGSQVIDLTNAAQVERALSFMIFKNSMRGATPAGIGPLPGLPQSTTSPIGVGP